MYFCELKTQTFILGPYLTKDKIRNKMDLPSVNFVHIKIPLMCTHTHKKDSQFPFSKRTFIWGRRRMMMNCELGFRADFMQFE